MKAALRRLDFKGFFELLDRNSNENAFVFVLENLDKDELKYQFDDHNVVFNYHIRDGELGKILTPSLEELCCLKRVILIFTIIVLSIDWLVIFTVATN